jgi:hypothetical protein
MTLHPIFAIAAVTTIAAEYAPPEGFSQWVACAFYMFGIFVAIRHYQTLGHTKNVRIQGDIATMEEVKLITDKLLEERTFNNYKETAERDREDLKECLKEVKADIDKANDKLDKFGTDQYKARRALHGKVNAQSNALYFIAGQHKDGREIKNILDRAQALNTEADGE